jgi:hypothetical protein
MGALEPRRVARFSGYCGAQHSWLRTAGSRHTLPAPRWVAPGLLARGRRMMNRSSKAITLVLVGSTAALAGFGVLDRATHRAGDDAVQSGDFGPEEESFVGDGSTQPSTRPGGSRVHPVGAPGYSSNRYRTYSSSRYRSTPIGRSGGSSGSSGNVSGSSSSGSSSSSSGSSGSHGSGTSRGGFGSSGHAASSAS